MRWEWCQLFSFSFKSIDRWLVDLDDKSESHSHTRPNKERKGKSFISFAFSLSLSMVEDLIETSCVCVCEWISWWTTSHNSLSMSKNVQIKSSLNFFSFFISFLLSQIWTNIWWWQIWWFYFFSPCRRPLVCVCWIDVFIQVVCWFHGFSDLARAQPSSSVNCKAKLDQCQTDFFNQLKQYKFSDHEMSYYQLCRFVSLKFIVKVSHESFHFDEPVRMDRTCDSLIVFDRSTNMKLDVNSHYTVNYVTSVELKSFPIDIRGNRIWHMIFVIELFRLLIKVGNWLIDWWLYVTNNICMT